MSRFDRHAEAIRCMGCMELFDGQYDVCPHCGYVVGTEPETLFQIRPGTALADRYLIGRALGYGSFGVTYLGWDGKLQRKVAIKEYLPSQFATRELENNTLLINGSEKETWQFQRGMKRFLEEGRKLAQVGNIDGIVHMYDVFEANNTAYIAMEYLHGETLSDFLAREGKLTEQMTKELMVPLLKALQEVHDKGIIHRDIAPDNIFLSKDKDDNVVVKLIDFGAAKFSASSHSKSLTVLIKPGFSPEEQYRSDGEQGTYTDVYALAAVMYRMVTGVQPPDAFERRTAIETKRRDLLEEPSKFQPELSDNFEIALLNALNVRIEDRTATADQFLEELISFEPVQRRGSTIRKVDFLRWPLWAKISVPAASLAAVALLVFAFLKVFHIGPQNYVLPEGMTRVPDFITASYEEAQAWAEEKQLLLEDGGREYAPNTVSDLVLSQSVSSGEIVEVNRVVSVILSTGEEHYPIPDVRGMTLDAAKAALECTGLEVETKEEAQGGLAKDCVVSQSMESFTESTSGETIVLGMTASGCSKEGKAPELTGLSYSEALAAAEKAGAVLCVTEWKFTKEQPDQVLSQSVKAGEDLEKDQTIQITVSQQWREFQMPNLLYKDQKAAQQLLKNLGLKTELQEEENEILAAGLVAGQDIEKDTTVQPGDTVKLRVSKGGKPVSVPNVVGATEEEARKQLTEARMSVNVEYDYDASAEDGAVISQSIDGTAPRGTAITIVVCSSDGLVKVENVVGMTSSEAQSALKAQGFKVQVNETNSSAEKGTVTAQLPAAGSVQKEGATIVITVSKGQSTGGSSSGGNGNGQSTATSAPRASTKPSGSNGAWSDWSTSKPSGSNYEVESKTQYRSRDLITEKTDTIPDGRAIASVTTNENNEPWSDWQTTYVSESDTREVETRTSSKPSMYYLAHYCDPNFGTGFVGNWDPTGDTYYGGGITATYHVYGWASADSTTPFGQSTLPEHDFHSTGSPCPYGFDQWYPFDVQYTEVTEYRYRKRVPKYTIEYYYDWSEWSDTNVGERSYREVETRTVYRYRIKGS